MEKLVWKTNPTNSSSPDFLESNRLITKSSIKRGYLSRKCFWETGFHHKNSKFERAWYHRPFHLPWPDVFWPPTKALPDLCCLDLSGAKHRQGMTNFQWLLNCRQLASLTLHNVQEVETSLPVLCQLQLVAPWYLLVQGVPSNLPTTNQLPTDPGD